MLAVQPCREVMLERDRTVPGLCWGCAGERSARQGSAAWAGHAAACQRQHLPSHLRRRLQSVPQYSRDINAEPISRAAHHLPPGRRSAVPCPCSS